MQRSWKWMLCALATPGLAIASGQLDPDFGDNGTLVVHADLIAPSGDEQTYDGFVDHAGRYVSVGTADYEPEGYFYNQDQYVGKVGMITRHLPNGTLDQEFGIGGVAHQEVSGYFLEWRVASEQPDGKILVAGNQTPVFYQPPGPPAIICRLEENGELDKKFGINGCRWLEFPLIEEIHAVVAMDVGPEGLIVVLGGSYGAKPFAVARMNADGSNDKCFGDPNCTSGGLVRGPEKLADIAAREVAIDSFGGLVVAGDRENKLDPNDPDNLVTTYTSVAFRLSPAGKLDAAFGVEGIRKFDVSTLFQGQIVDQRVSRMLPDGMGGFLVVGYVALDEDKSSTTMLARMTANGSLDPDFASNGLGIFQYDAKAVQNWTNNLSIQSDGKLLVAGTAEYEDQSWRLAVMRFSFDGALDKHFGSNGTATF